MHPSIHPSSYSLSRLIFWILPCLRFASGAPAVGASDYMSRQRLYSSYELQLQYFLQSIVVFVVSYIYLSTLPLPPAKPPLYTPWNVYLHASGSSAHHSSDFPLIVDKPLKNSYFNPTSSLSQLNPSLQLLYLLSLVSQQPDSCIPLTIAGQPLLLDAA